MIIGADKYRTVLKAQTEATDEMLVAVYKSEC
jgi:hypothetical protein